MDLKGFVDKASNAANAAKDAALRAAEQARSDFAPQPGPDGARTRNAAAKQREAEGRCTHGGIPVEASGADASEKGFGQAICRPSDAGLEGAPGPCKVPANGRQRKKL